MRTPARTNTAPSTAPGSLSSKALLLAAVAFLLAAAMQLATAWLQRERARLQCTAGSGAGSPWTTAQPPLSLSFEDEYTWEGDDFPPALPLDLGPPVALTIEDSRHYTLDAPAASLEWHSLYPGNDLGFLRLGPNKRFFSLALYHQMHCLESLRQGVLQSGAGGHGHGKRSSAHASHCLNYLRQTILCAADLTLEPEIEPGSGNVGEGLGVTHVCKDWSKVHEFAARNWEEWDDLQSNRTREPRT